MVLIEEKTLDFYKPKIYVPSQMWVIVVALLFFFDQSRIIAQAIICAYIVYLLSKCFYALLKTKLVAQKVLEDDDQHINFYRGGFIVFRVKKSDIEAIEYVHRFLFLKTVNILLISGQPHDVYLPISSYFKMSLYKEKLGAIV